MLKVRVLGAPGTGFSLGQGKDVYAGDVLDLEDRDAKPLIAQGTVELVEGDLPPPQGRVDPDQQLHTERPSRRRSGP